SMIGCDYYNEPLCRTVVIVYYGYHPSHLIYFCFFFNDTATTDIYTLSLHDALPICSSASSRRGATGCSAATVRSRGPRRWLHSRDRKSTRLNSSHVKISYAVFCLKKKKKNHPYPPYDTRLFPSTNNCIPLHSPADSI